MDGDNADDLADRRPVKAMATPTHTAKRLPMGLTEDDDHSLLFALGAALVMNWENIPQDLQRDLFQGATDVMEVDQGMELREQLARFIHDHKNAAD
jgi:hypothetical protein